MSKKCRAYSSATNGTEKVGYKDGFFSGWDMYKKLNVITHEHQPMRIWLKSISIGVTTALAVYFLLMCPSLSQHFIVFYAGCVAAFVEYICRVCGHPNSDN